MAPALETSLSSLALSSDLNTRVYYLLHEEQFAESLKLAQSKDASSKVSKLYTAYALYRLGREEECLTTLGNAQDRASRHLRAQALYRLERVSISDLSPLRDGTVVANEDADIRVNEAAIAAQRALLSKPVAHFEESPQAPTHEFLFNKSIYLHARGLTENAIKSLHEAITVLKSLELDQAEYDAELAPIHAQIAHLTNDADLNKSASSKDTDSTTRFLTGINFIEESNPYALFKAYSAGSRLRPSARLFTFQDRLVAYDRIIVLHLIGLSIKRAVKKYISLYSEIDPERCSALKALLHSKSSKQSLETRLKDDSSDIDAAVALISRLVRQKQGVHRAIKVIEQLPAQTRNQSPGVIGIWAALSRLTGKSETSSIIESALEQCTGVAREQLLAGFIQQSIVSSKPGSITDDATEARLQELLTLNPENVIGQSAKCVLHPEYLLEPMQLPDLSSVDVLALELGQKRPVEDDTSRRPTKKVRTKTKEQLEAEAKLDPERWLPKRDRSNYKPSKKDKMKAKGGHQGGLVDESLASRGPAPVVKTSEVQRKKKKKGGK